MATGEKTAGAARTAGKKKFKSGPAAPDMPQLQDEIAKLTKRFPGASFERTPQEDGSVVVALVDKRIMPPNGLAFAIGTGANTAEAVDNLKENMPLTRGGAK